MLDAGDPFDLVGDVLDGQFRVDQFAGEGDLSVVYRGHHMGVDAPVAIKCLNLPATLDPKLLEPFTASFREGARLHYRLAQGNLHIAQSIAFGNTLAPRTGVTIPFLVREWLDGCSLATHFDAREKNKLGPRALGEVLELLDSAADALGYAHAQGVAHHSIHPRNLFIASTARGKVIKLLDFGAARELNEHSVAEALPGVGLRILFPTYAAPEQLDRTLAPGRVMGFGATTDVYSFALIVYEAMAGRPVLARNLQAADVLHTFRPKARPTARSLGLMLGREVEDVLDRALALDPNLRQSNVGEFWRDLKEAGQKSKVVARPERKVPTVATVMTAPMVLPKVVKASVTAHPPVTVPSPPLALEELVPEKVVPVPVPAPFFPAPPAPVAAVPSPVVTEPLPLLQEAAPSAPQAFAASTSDSAPQVWLASLAAFPFYREWVTQCSFAATLVVGLSLFALIGPRTARAVSHRNATVRFPTTTVAVAAPTTVEPIAPEAAPSPRPVRHDRFDREGALQAFAHVASDLPSCTVPGGPRGLGSIRVRFEPDGHISRITIGPPYAGTKVGNCIAERFSVVTIPTFRTGAMALNYTFDTIDWDDADKADIAHHRDLRQPHRARQPHRQAR